MSDHNGHQIEAAGPIVTEGMSVQEIVAQQKLAHAAGVTPEMVIVAKAELETQEAKRLLVKFARARDAEMRRLITEVIKPHMRGFAKTWFEEHGLPVPPDLVEGPVGFAG